MFVAGCFMHAVQGLELCWLLSHCESFQMFQSVDELQSVPYSTSLITHISPPNCAAAGKAHSISGQEFYSDTFEDNFKLKKKFMKYLREKSRWSFD